MSFVIFPHQKKQIKLLIVFVLLLIVMGLVWLFAYSDISFFKQSESVEPIDQINNIDLGSLNEDLLNDPLFEGIESYGAELELNDIGPIGRENPFEPYQGEPLFRDK